jgi:hypothetical protein
MGQERFCLLSIGRLAHPFGADITSKRYRRGLSSERLADGT